MSATIIDFATGRTTTQPATDPTPCKRRVRKPAGTPRPNAAKIAEKGRLSRHANATVSELYSVSFELLKLKQRILEMLDDYDAMVIEATNRTRHTIIHLRDEAHARVESGSLP